jgi:iron complex outermembrane receptor protein
VIIFNLLVIFIEAVSSDSLNVKNYETSELEVQSERSFSKNAYKFNSTIKIERSEIKKYPGLDMNNILQSSPGFYIKDYGGLSGLKTVSIRGSSSSQVQIMINGMPINSNQNGSIDFGLFPKNMINSLELSRGGLSADGGNNSVSGSVDISIKPNISNRFQSNFSYGSFNALNLDLNYNILDQQKPISFFASINTGDGDYTFKDRSGNDKKRENSGYMNFTTAFVSKNNLANFNIFPLLLIKYEKKGVPGAVLGDRTLNSNAETEQKYLLASFTANRPINDRSIFSIKSSFVYDDFNYNDNIEEINTIGSNSNFYNRTLRFKPEFYTNFFDVKIRSGVDYEYTSLNGDFLDPTIEDNINRNSISFYLSWVYEMTNKNFNTDIIAAVRWNAVDKINPLFTHNIGVITNYNRLPLFFKLNFSRNFRLPTFNEMYYLNYGNSELDPELSYSLNASILFELEDLSLDITGFRVETDDLIVSVPKSPVSWSAQNVGLAVSNGIEIMLKTKLLDIIQMTFSYTLQDVKDKSRMSITNDKLIPYIPQEILISMLNVNFNPIEIGTVVNYSSHRFSLPDNSFNSLLESYYEIDVFALYNFDDPNINFRFEVNNLSNNTFSIIKNFPMPGRNFTLSVGYEL